MLWFSRILRQSSGLLPIMQLFQIIPLKGLISAWFFTPKEFRDIIEKGLSSQIQGLVQITSFSSLLGAVSLRVVSDWNDFLEWWSGEGSSCQFLWFDSFISGSGPLFSQSALSQFLILRLTRWRILGCPLRKQGWLNIFLAGSLRLLWKPYMLSWRMKELMFLCRKQRGRIWSWNSSIYRMANSRPLASQWMMDSYCLFQRIQKLFWMKLAMVLSGDSIDVLYISYVRYFKYKFIYGSLIVVQSCQALFTKVSKLRFGGYCQGHLVEWDEEGGVSLDIFCQWLVKNQRQDKGWRFQCSK